MSRPSLLTIVCLSCLTTAAGTSPSAVAPQPSITYALAGVNGKLVRHHPPPEQRLAGDDAIAAGDVLATGWWSSAQIIAPDAGARFVVKSRTRVRLATDEPGVLLEVQRGRLRAIFDALSEGASRERLVTTPSAVLAVRGTQYGVAVAGNGDTSIVVFEGEVEVASSARLGPPVVVNAGQWSTVARHKAPVPPRPHTLRPEDWDRGRSPSSPSAHRSDRGSAPDRGRSMGTTSDRMRSPRPPMGSSRSSGTD